MKICIDGINCDDDCKILFLLLLNPFPLTKPSPSISFGMRSFSNYIETIDRNRTDLYGKLFISVSR